MTPLAIAHKKLGGNLNNSEDFQPSSDCFLYYDHVGGFYICCECAGFFDGIYEYISTVEEFNNFKGDDMKIVIDYTSAEFWKDAPEGVTHYILGKFKYANSDFVIEESDRYTGTKAGINHWLKSELVDQDDFEIIERPVKPSPTYTQEMADNGVLPSVGLDCLVIGKSINIWYECEIIAHTDIGVSGLELAVFRIKNHDGLAYYYSDAPAENFKPLTPPVKLDDGKAYQFDIEFIGTVCGIYYKAHDELNGSEDNYPREICANIQPLTVGNK